MRDTRHEGRERNQFPFRRWSIRILLLYYSRCHFQKQSISFVTSIYSKKIVNGTECEVIGLEVVRIGLECQQSQFQNTVTLFM